MLPGSEAERQLLKEWILEALPDADARQINVPWPSAPTALPEDILITATVGGTECGAVSEMTQKVSRLFFLVADLKFPIPLCIASSTPPPLRVEIALLTKFVCKHTATIYNEIIISVINHCTGRYFPIV